MSKNRSLFRLMPISVKQITCREHGTEYQTWMVDGYVNGKRIRIRCKSESEALMRKSEKETEAINAERSSRFIQTRLTAAQLNEAESCFDRLAPKYALTEAVDYFLRHFRAPDFAITISEASTRFQTELEGTIRTRTLLQIGYTLRDFEQFTDNTHVHEITPAIVEGFLNSLRARDGVNKASKKSWNNTRQIVNQFFGWCKSKRCVSENPVVDIKRFKIDSEHIDVLPVDKCQDLMKHVAEFKGGKLVWYFGLALFAGIRPGNRGELEKLADSPGLVDLENKVIRITAAISKTRKARQVKIRPNLLKWLKRYPADIMPINVHNEVVAIRKSFNLSHDVLRHTFISSHVMAFGSFAETAIEAGNSEQIIREHYLNVITRAQAKAFWKIEPNL